MCANRMSLITGLSFPGGGQKFDQLRRNRLPLETQTDHLRNRFPGILGSRIWTLRCWTILEWQTIRLRRCQTSQVTLIEQPECPCELIFGDTGFSDMETLVPDDSGVANHLLLEIPDLAGDFNRTNGMPLLGSGELISGDTKF